MNEYRVENRQKTIQVLIHETEKTDIVQNNIKNDIESSLPVKSRWLVSCGGTRNFCDFNVMDLLSFRSFEVSIRLVLNSNDVDITTMMSVRRPWEDLYDITIKTFDNTSGQRLFVSMNFSSSDENIFDEKSKTIKYVGFNKTVQLYDTNIGHNEYLEMLIDKFLKWIKESAEKVIPLDSLEYSMEVIGGK